MLVTYVVTIHCDECQFTDSLMYQNFEPSKKKVLCYIHRKQCDSCWGIYLNRNKT